MDVNIVVATYGDRKWPRLALERAIPSARRQAPTIHVHSNTLQNARNKGLGQVETEFVIHLDADDELAPGYVVAMSKGRADLRVAAVSYIRDGRAARPQMPRVVGHQHACSADCLDTGNWIAVGACVRTQLLRDIGGWGSEPLYEDYALWKRARDAGATIEAIPDAVYRAHAREASRNQAPHAERVKWTRAIQSASC